MPSLDPPRVYLTTIPHTQPLSSRTFSSSLGLGDLQEQGWLCDEARGDEGGSRGSPRRRVEEGELGLSLDQYSHLLPAGPGRTSRSETHLLADIKPPYLRAILHPAPPLLVHPSSFLSSRRGLLAGPLGKPSRFASVETS